MLSAAEKNEKSLAQKLKELDQLELATLIQFNEEFNNTFRVAQFLPPFSTESKSTDPEKSKKILTLHEQLVDQQKLRKHLTTELLNLNNNDQEKFWEEYSKKEDKKIFDDFINHLNKNNPDSNQDLLLGVKADSLKLMSYPSGRKVLRKLNEFLAEGKELLIVQSEKYSCGASWHDSSERRPRTTHQHRPRLDAEEIQQISEYQEPSFDRLKQSYKKKERQHPRRDVRDLKGIVINVPLPNPSSIRLYVAMKPNSQEEIILANRPSYRSFYHELCHGLRNLRGANKSLFPLPRRYHSLYSQSAEELWTINLGKTSEETLSKEDQLPLRMTHKGVTLSIAENQSLCIENKDKNKEEEVSLTTGAILMRVFIGDKDFRKVKIKDIQFDEKSEISGVDFTDAVFENVCFSTSLIANSNLSNVSFKNTTFCLMAEFKDVILKNANFENLDLREIIFTGQVDLSNTNLKGVDLRGVDLSSVDLTGADLEGAKLEGALLEGAKLDHANLRGTILESKAMKKGP